MIEFAFTTEVARPPHEVFAYLSDPEKLYEWQGTAEVVKLTDGPVGEGTRFREVHERMGRRIESVTEVSAYEPDRRFDIRIVEGPLPVDGRWDLEPAGAGSRIRFAATGRARGPMRILEPLLRRFLERQFRRDHERLRQALESRP